tara:strand:- start:13870 stop:14538 length:669 start_codon:yes stop_codon:yes gene_type:complete
MSSASPGLKDWLRIRGGVQWHPTPGHNLNLPSADPYWAEFLEGWRYSVEGLKEWRARLDEPSKYGSYSNRRIFLSFELVKSSVRNLLLGATDRAIENIYGMAENNGITTMPAAFDGSDALEDYERGQVNKIIELAARAGYDANQMDDLMDDLMLPYFYVSGGHYLKNNANQWIPVQGYFGWYEYRFGRGFTTHISGLPAANESSEIQNMGLDDIDLTSGSDY